MTNGLQNYQQFHMPESSDSLRDTSPVNGTYVSYEGSFDLNSCCFPQSVDFNTTTDPNEVLITYHFSEMELSTPWCVYWGVKDTTLNSRGKIENQQYIFISVQDLTYSFFSFMTGYMQNGLSLNQGNYGARCTASLYPKSPNIEGIWKKDPKTISKHCCVLEGLNISLSSNGGITTNLVATYDFSKDSSTNPWCQTYFQTIRQNFTETLNFNFNTRLWSSGYVGSVSYKLIEEKQLHILMEGTPQNQTDQCSYTMFKATPNQESLNWTNT